MGMNEQEKQDKTTPPPLRGTSPYTGEAREKVIMGLEWALENMVDPINDFRFAGYDGPCVLLNQPIVSDALALLKAQEPNEDWISRKRLKDEIQYYIDEAGWGDEANKVLGWCMEFIDNQRAVKWE